MTNLNFNTSLVPANLAEMKARILADPTLDKTTRRDLVSAIDLTAAILEREPEDLHAHVASLRQGLLLAHPTQIGITPKTLSNLKSNLSRALVLTGIIPVRDLRSLRSEAWEEFLRSAEHKHQIYGLSRFASFCSRRGIDPIDVVDAVVAEYRHVLDLTLLTNDPEKVCKETVQTFNRIAKSAKLGLQRLTPITKGQYRARPLRLYLPAFQKDLARYKDRLTHADIMSDEGPTKPLRPTSVRNIEAHIRQHLDAAVASGYPSSEFRELGDLLHPDIVRASFGLIIERNGGEAPVGLKNIAGTLLAIARHYANAPVDHIAFLKKILERLGASTGTSEYGMSEKNVERLSQFDDWRNLVRLIALPEQLMARAKLNPGSPRSALDAMFAVAIAILLACPMRAQNLASLDLERHLSHRVEGKKRRYSIRVEGREVKNGTAIEVDLGDHASELLTIYLKTFRKRLSNTPDGALFPKRSGGARSPANLSQDLGRKIYRETGLVVHGHLFRHIAAKLYLDRMPGDYETVRRLLGHKKLETTMQFYARLESKAAFKQYDEKVLSRFRRGRHE